MLYAASFTGKNGKTTQSLFALSARDGSVVWQRNSSTKALVDEVLATDNMPFIVTSYNTTHMNAYDATTGKSLWSVPLNGPTDSLTTYDGYIYVDMMPSSSRSVYVLNARDGSLSYRENFALAATVAIEQGIIYVVEALNGNVTLTMINTVTRKSSVTYRIPSSVSLETPPVIRGNPAVRAIFIYLSVSPNQVVVLRASDGKLLQTFTLGKTMNPPLFDYVLVTVIS